MKNLKIIIAKLFLLTFVVLLCLCGVGGVVYAITQATIKVLIFICGLCCVVLSTKLLKHIKINL